MPRSAALATVCMAAATASADPDPVARDFVYIEALGKAGAYGVGYERSLAPPVAVGAAASYVVVRDDELATVAPYLHVTLLAGRANALFAELGVDVVHQRITSPVADWKGMSSTGAGAFSGLGWRRTLGRLELRTTGSLAVGRGGIAPLIGFSLGFRP